MSQDVIDGRLERVEGGYALRYERRLKHPVEKVWKAITDPGRLAGWLGAAEVELVDGGAFVVRWLNTDPDDEPVIARGTITRLDPPHVLEVDTDVHGLLRWQLSADGPGCRLTLSVTVPLADEELTMVLAGWHVHLDFLEDALEGRPVDWPNWPIDRWSIHHVRYVARFG